jgi:hypothetical protein
MGEMTVIVGVSFCTADFEKKVATTSDAEPKRERDGVGFRAAKVTNHDYSLASGGLQAPRRLGVDPNRRPH